ncbi:YfhO family protein [uncultured Planktosalinus sp.]|uniref:YfhO family protein n=1 Tax=uncultured Planktosalinus sp. TaxID=1810935 RepID=UPI0030DD1494
MKDFTQKYLPHLIVLTLFIIVSLFYFSPVLQGKQILQSDIVQYTGMAKQHNDYREATGEESYWTNSAFGGMPTYQLGAQYPHNYIKQLDRTLRFLPRPADYLFLYFIGFYILLLVLKVDYKLAALGALGFGFSTYLIIILGGGHNAKAHAIAYMPLVLAGIFLVFQKKYLWGFILFSLAMALEISANHFQMTYYLLILVLVVGIVYLMDAFKNKELPHFFKAVGLMVAGVIIAVGLNATNILATQEYAAESTRGQSELTITPDGAPKDNTQGLSKEYITEYSYGLVETFNLFIPRFMGGGNVEDVGTDSATYDFLMKRGLSPAQASDFVTAVPTYWGQQPIVAAPAYIGAVILFLSILGVFLLKGKHKRWLIAGSLVALFLSWGKNAEFLTNLFIDYFPLYDKFRAVSSIQVIIELCMPILAVLGLQKLISSKIDQKEKIKALKYSGGILGVLCLLFLFFKNSLFSFSGVNDGYYIQAYGQEFMDAIKEDRKSIFIEDTLRSLGLVIVAGTTLYLYLINKLNQNALVLIMGVLIIFDLVSVDKRYVNNDNFVTTRQMNTPFQQTQADAEISKDKTHFRVYDLSSNPFGSGRASYFHNALGGYHAAKPGRIQDLYDFYLEKGSLEVFNMFNVKYLLERDDEGKVLFSENYEANGNAWFVDSVVLVDNADEEILSIAETNTKKKAIIHKEFSNLLPTTNMQVDSTAIIDLVKVRPDYLHYETDNSQEGIVVFSEVYYPYGWNAYINGKPQEHFRANYALRAMVIPPGYNKIEFKFEPEVIETGSKISLASSILFLILLIGAVFVSYRKKK